MSPGGGLKESHNTLTVVRPKDRSGSVIKTGSLEGYIDYKRREYCNDIHCTVQMLLNQQKARSAAYDEMRAICTSGCIHSTYEFHHWLIEKGYLLVRPGK